MFWIKLSIFLVYSGCIQCYCVYYFPIKNWSLSLQRMQIFNSYFFSNTVQWGKKWTAEGSATIALNLLNVQFRKTRYHYLAQAYMQFLCVEIEAVYLLEFSRKYIWYFTIYFSSLKNFSKGWLNTVLNLPFQFLRAMLGWNMSLEF